MSACFSLMIDVGEGTPPVISLLSIDGNDTVIADISIRNTSALVKALNSVRNGFTVTQTDDGVLIGYSHCDVDSISLTIDGNVEDMEKQDCDCCSACFTEQIGLQDICETQRCKLYINDLGIDRRFLEQTITSGFKGVQDFFESQKRLAQKDITAMINSYMSPKFYANSLIGEGKIGFLDDSYKSPSGLWHGVVLQMEDGDYRTYISKISLTLDYTGKVAVCIFDIETGQMLDAVLINAIKGINTSVNTNILIKADNIFIGYEAEGRHRKSILARGICCGKTTKQCTGFKATGVYGDISDMRNLRSTQETGGLHISYSIRCDHESWICRNADLMTLPMFYRTAMNIYGYALTHSKHSRINTVVTINTEELESSLQWATDKFNGCINDALRNLKVPANRCFNCNEYARVVLSMP